MGECEREWVGERAREDGMKVDGIRGREGGTDELNGWRRGRVNE